MAGRKVGVTETLSLEETLEEPASDSLAALALSAAAAYGPLRAAAAGALLLPTGDDGKVVALDVENLIAAP